MKRMTGDDLSNPIIGAWITSFIRSTVSECLHGIQALNGKIVSVTTDGFITDIENLEYKLLKYYRINKQSNSLLKEYRSLRKYLSGKYDALEIKKEGKI